MMEITFQEILGILLSFLILLLAALFIHWWVRARAPNWRPLTRYIFIVLFISWVCAIFLWFDLYPPLRNWVAFVWTLLVAFIGLRALDFILFKRLHLGFRVPRLVRDLLFFFILLLVVMAALQNFFNLRLTTLITTSALVTIIIGLALQETLSNLFAGLSLNFENAFNLGDWIQVDGRPGQVIQMNWRSVHLKTLTGEVLVYPNARIAREILVNYSSSPEPYRWRVIRLGLNYEAPPALVESVVQETVKNLLGPDAPPPEIRVKDFQDFAVLYEIRYPYRDFSVCERFDALIRRNLWYALKRERLEIPFPIRTVYLHREKPRRKIIYRRVKRYLKRHPVFSRISPSRLHQLARRCRIQVYTRNELIIREGDRSTGMFLLTRGRIRIFRKVKRKMKELAVLEAGEIFGEMALLSDAPRTASVQAETDCEVIFIPSRDVHRLLDREEQFAEALFELFESRKEILESAEDTTLSESTLGSTSGAQDAPPSDFLRRIRHLFGFKGSSPSGD